MDVAFRYTKAMRNATLYVRIPLNNQFWDFVNVVWVNNEVSGCRMFLSEFGDSSTIESWYSARFDLPPGDGPYNIEIANISSGVVVGNDFYVSSENTAPQSGDILSSTLIAAAARQLQDISNITWPSPVLLVYLNYAIREILILKPEANAVLDIVSLAAGTRQTVPIAWNILLNVKRNMGSNGQTPGRVIISIPPQAMDSILPDWHTWPAGAEVYYAIIDERNPRVFDVWPPQPVATTQKIEVLGSTFPAKIADTVNGVFPLPDDYEVMAVDYVIYRALNESTTIPNALAKATAMLQKFYQGLNIQSRAEDKNQAKGQ